MPIRLKALKPKETDFEPQTLGQHLRKRRLEQRLTQRQVANQRGINPWTVLSWEKGHTEPPVKSMPAILRFLGYNPFPETKSMPERLLTKRRAMGWSIKKAASELGVDEGTWAAWESGKPVQSAKHRRMIATIVGSQEKI